MDLAGSAQSQHEVTQTQIARLREQVESLLKDRVTPAVAGFAEKAETAIHTASDTARQQAEVLSGQVKQKPLLAIGLAATLGWIIGRAMR